MPHQKKLQELIAGDFFNFYSMTSWKQLLLLCAATVNAWGLSLSIVTIVGKLPGVVKACMDTLMDNFTIPVLAPHWLTRYFTVPNRCKLPWCSLLTRFWHTWHRIWWESRNMLTWKEVGLWMKSYTTFGSICMIRF